MSGWQQDALDGYLDTATEREFDATFLALLHAQGYKRIHLIHGAFEFGKDFIAQKDGIQYAFQTKAGDIGLSAWRAIRSQIEEMIWNDIAHPDFDVAAERRAILVTTGRLTGGAPADAQQYAAALARRRPNGRRLRDVLRRRLPEPFEVWDRDSLLATAALTPSISFSGWSEQTIQEMLGLLADIGRRSVTARGLERATRDWHTEDPPRVALGVAVIANRLRSLGRLDLACTAACCLMRAGAVGAGQGGDDRHLWLLDAGRQLFDVFATELIDASDRLIDDPRDLVNVGNEVIGGASYRVRCSTLVETMGLLGLLRAAEGEQEEAEGLASRLADLIEHQPGAAQPISDVWACSLVPAATLLRRAGSAALVPWLEQVVVWTADRYDGASGLASVYAEPLDELRYLLGAPLQHIDVRARTSSHLATTTLDLACALELADFYRDAYNDLAAVDVAFPALEPTDEGPGQYLFDGSSLQFEANSSFDEQHDFSTDWRAAPHHRRSPASFDLQRAGRTWEIMAISTILRDRHFLAVTRELAALEPLAPID